MSPARRRHIALFSALGLVFLLLFYWPLLFYLSIFFGFGISALYFHDPESFYARLGLNPRTGVNIQTVNRRWVRASGLRGAAEKQVKFGSGRSNLSSRETAHNDGQRLSQSGPYRQEALNSDSLLFSPRDLLMGSYITKADSPVAANNLQAPRNPRDELRERLHRPNYAVYTPNRRLSFSGDVFGSGSRFTITPQRHYPLQQQGASPLGVLPPHRWEGFRPKSVLSPRNSCSSSPVTVKIARPDTHGLDHVCSPVVPRAEADPCSRESVLKVLKESRKREVDEEHGLSEQQRNKRRRNDSGGSAQSAFEPLLPNGTSPLIPKPGSLKRGLTALEEQNLKRSRTSSVSSTSGGAAVRATNSSRRNPISSSYSSTQGLAQRKRPLPSESPLSSPGPSRPHSPENSSKKTREEEQQKSPSPAPCEPSDSSLGQTPAQEDSSSALEPAVSLSERTHSGGKRRRKIQLATRDDNLSLPPPPELGYSVTAQDLDEEKRSALIKIYKLLETPAPEPPSSSLPSTSVSNSSLSSSAGPLGGALSFSVGTVGTSLTSSTAAASSSLSAPSSSAGTLTSTLTSTAGTLGGALGAPLGSSMGSSAVTLGNSLGTGTLAGGVTPLAQANLLLETLKRKSPSPAAAVTAVSAPVQPVLSLQTSVLPASTSVSVVPPSTAPSFTQPTTLGPGLFSPTATSSSTPPLPTTAFKPLFPTPTTSSAPETKPQQTFKPIFGAAPSSLSSTSAVSSASVFGGASGTTQPLSSGERPSLLLSSTLSTKSGSITATFGGFGTTSTITNPQSAFGTTTTTSSQPTFGTSVTAGSSAPLTFGTTTVSSQSAFGTTISTNTAPAPTFGTTAPSSKPAPTFGTTAAPLSAFGTTTVTVAPSTLSFGTTTASSQPAPTFGTASSQPVMGFGTATASQSVSTATTAAQSVLTFGASSQSAFGATTTAPPALSFGTTAASQSAFGATTTAQSALTFGTTAPSQNTFSFVKPPLDATSSQPSFTAAAEPPKPFTFGAAAPSVQSTAAPAPTTAPSFGTLTTPSFSFGGSSTPAPVAPAASALTPGTFSFGSPAPAPQPAPSNAQPSTPFKFGAAPSVQFGTPGNSTAPQMGAFTFGSSAPVFGQTSTPAPISFGPGTAPTPSFNATPFGSTGTPSFSIGAGSKTTATRQRLQGRRQHTRKK